MSFALHPQLAADTLHVTDLVLGRVLLMNDSRFPWAILVPMREGLRDFHDVAPGDKADFFSEIDRVSAVLKGTSGAYKMNVAALGNMVPQLHIHIIARFEGDPAWPNPVWGSGKPVPYDPAEASALVEKLRTGLYG